MKFLKDYPSVYDLTYSDVFLVPQLNDISSRMDVKLTTPDGVGSHIPLVVANMNAVAGKRMAETVARRGGITVLPQDIPLTALQEIIGYLKKCQVVFETPLTLMPASTVAEALNIIHKRAHQAVIVINDKDQPIGIFKESDAQGYDRFTPLGEVVSGKVASVPSSYSPEQMFIFLNNQRLSVAPIVKSNKLVGIITRKGAMRSKLYPPAVDKKGRLLVAVAVGINGDIKQKVSSVLDAGADVIVLDTAHGHQTKMIAAIKAARKVSKDLKIVAGNIVTAEATRDLLNAGADIVKVGVGPGAMCTTRMMTGVGRPQFSAVLECSQAAKELGGHVWADGGIRYPRDVALALAAGASNVMVGSWLAGTYESSADILIDNQGRLYKENYGMASRRAVKNRYSSENVFSQALRELFEEGISKSKKYLDPEMPGVEDIIDHIMAGVRSSLTYMGAKTIEEFQKKAVVGIQSVSGYSEGQAVKSDWSLD